MSVATVIESGLDRHALLAPECECGVCAPTWARRRGKSRRFAEAVTLVEALHGEATEVRADMVREHREFLSVMVCEVDQLREQVDSDDLGHPGVGLALVMFAGELASALRPTEFGAELTEGPAFGVRADGDRGDADRGWVPGRGGRDDGGVG